MGIPIYPYTRTSGTGTGTGAGEVGKGGYHLSIPSRSKMDSRCATCAGVSTFHSPLLSSSSSSSLSFSPCTLDGTNETNAPSDSSRVENAIFARCRFRLVICTERTAA